MNIRDNASLKKGGPMKKVVYWYYLHMYRKVFEASQEELLSRYFELSVQDTLSEVDLEELDFILELAQHSQKLTILIHLVDQFIDESLERFDESYKEEIEQSRTRSLEKILGGSIEHSATAHQEGKETVHGFSPARDALALKTAFDTNKSPIEHAAKSVNDCLGKLLPPLKKYCTHLTKIKPLKLSRQGLLCLTFGAVGAFCSSYKDDVAKVARMFFSTVETPLAQTEAANVGGTAHNVVNYVSHKPDFSKECRNQSVGWIDPTLDGEFTLYEEVFKNSEATAAHAFLPPGSKIHLKSEATGQPVVVKVNERVKQDEQVDEQSKDLLVSYSAARQLGVVEAGVAPVTVEHVEVSQQKDVLSETQRRQLAHFQEDCSSLVESR
ncbi:MAG: RlpA-like double-psi beta-barrel domain-containing protein [Elainellaceae cyanobacterium]